MRNCLSKFNDKPFTLHTPPLTAGHLKKVASGIGKNPAKYFASGVHRNHGYKKLTLSIKSNLMDVYDRFPPQSISYPKRGGKSWTKMKKKPLPGLGAKSPSNYHEGKAVFISESGLDSVIFNRFFFFFFFFF